MKNAWIYAVNKHDIELSVNHTRLGESTVMHSRRRKFPPEADFPPEAAGASTIFARESLDTWDTRDRGVGEEEWGVGAQDGYSLFEGRGSFFF
jgi:hypothetical protein